MACVQHYLWEQVQSLLKHSLEVNWPLPHHQWSIVNSASARSGTSWTSPFHAGIWSMWLSLGWACDLGQHDHICAISLKCLENSIPLQVSTPVGLSIFLNFLLQWYLSFVGNWRACSWLLFPLSSGLNSLRFEWLVEFSTVVSPGVFIVCMVFMASRIWGTKHVYGVHNTSVSCAGGLQGKQVDL